MIKEWIVNIIGIVALGILMDMIIPTGNIKSYTRFFIGLITLLVILQPLLKVLGQFSEFGDIFTTGPIGSIAAELDNVDNKIQTVAINHDKYLRELYKSNLEEDMVARLKDYIPDTEPSATVWIDDSGDGDMFSIERVDIVLEHSNYINIIPVDISIGSRSGDGSDGEKPYERDGFMDIDYEKIRKYLSDTYEIEESRIYINNK